MVIAVVAMGMVQVAVHEIVRVVAMRHRFMAAAGAVTVATLVPTAAMAGRAVARVVAIHLEAMFVDVPVVHVVQMPVVQVVRVAVVQHCGMAALRAMLMGVSFVPVVCHGLSWPEGYVAGRRRKNHTAECAARPQRLPGRSGPGAPAGHAERRCAVLRAGASRMSFVVRRGTTTIHEAPPLNLIVQPQAGDGSGH
jgi:hypothetical protein